jgi:hypothetical protein
MKKLSILLIGLLLITGFAFGIDVTPTVALAGTATVTWGVDLNTNATGFQNATTGSLTITFIAKATASKGAEDDLYGWIQIKDYSLTLTPTAAGGSAGTVTAKIVISPIEILIYGKPGMTWGNAVVLEAGDTDLAPALVGANTTGGITIVLPVDPAKISVYLVSDGDWTAANANTANDYGIGTDVVVTVDIVKISIGGYYGWLNATASYGATAGAVVTLADVLNGVTVDIGFDVIDPGTWEVDAITTVNISEANADDAKTNVALKVFYSQAADLDVTLGFSEPLAGGLIADVSASVMVQLFDLLSGTIVWNVDVDGKYSSGGLAPWFGFGYGSDTIFDLELGVDLMAAFTGIDNTTVTLKYISTQLAPAPADVGIITAAVKVAY